MAKDEKKQDDLNNEDCEYFIMERYQKEFLEEVLEIMKIDLKDFLELRNLKKIRERIKKLELENKALKLQQEEFSKRTIQLNNRLSNIETHKLNKQTADLMEYINNSDDDEDDDEEEGDS